MPVLRKSTSSDLLSGMFSGWGRRLREGAMTGAQNQSRGLRAEIITMPSRTPDVDQRDADRDYESVDAILEVLHNAVEAGVQVCRALCFPRHHQLIGGRCDRKAATSLWHL